MDGNDRLGFTMSNAEELSPGEAVYLEELRYLKDVRSVVSLWVLTFLFGKGEGRVPRPSGKGFGLVSCFWFPSVRCPHAL